MYMLINNNTKEEVVMQNFFLRAGNVMQIKYFKFNIEHGDYLLYIFTAKLGLVSIQRCGEYYDNC